MKAQTKGPGGPAEISLPAMPLPVCLHVPPAGGAGTQAPDSQTSLTPTLTHSPAAWWLQASPLSPGALLRVQEAGGVSELVSGGGAEGEALPTAVNSTMNGIISGLAPPSAPGLGTDTEEVMDRCDRTTEITSFLTCDFKCPGRLYCGVFLFISHRGLILNTFPSPLLWSSHLSALKTALHSAATSKGLP